MINTILGIKKNMTSTYDSRGRRVGATILEIAPNFVTQIKTSESSDGYNAVQIGVGTKKSVNKPQIGHAKKAGLVSPDGQAGQKIRWFREVRLKGEVENMKPGQEIKLDQVFSIGDVVKVTGLSKGRGFAGVVKRHGFAGGPKTHGQSDRHRAPGSIGSGTTPGRVYKGKSMAGHMGDESVSVKNLEVVGMDKLKNLLIVKGAIPGANGNLITITKLGRVKGYTPPPEEKPSEDEGEGESVKGEVKAENTVEVKQEAAEEKTVEPAKESTEGVQENAA